MTDPTNPNLSTIERDVDPDLVAEGKAARAAWAFRLGHPQRCKTNEVHPGLGCCLFCDAESGELCRGVRP